jgi:hypothetical protein
MTVEDRRPAPEVAGAALAPRHGRPPQSNRKDIVELDERAMKMQRQPVSDYARQYSARLDYRLGRLDDPA